MPLLKRLSVFAAATEAVIGTAETLVAADGQYNAYDVVLNPDIDVSEREAQGSMDHLQGIAGARGGTATFRTDLLYNGVTLPDWATVLLPACAWTDTLVPLTFRPVSEGLKAGGDVNTVTIGAYVDGRLKTIAGAVGNFKVMLEAGQLAFIEWTFTGVWQDVVDAALITPVYPPVQPARFADSATSFNAVDICVAALEIDAGNEVQLRECPDTVQGYESGIVVDRYPIIGADPEAQLVADNDLYGDLLANTQGIFTTQLKTTGTSTIDITAPQAQIFGIDETDRNKIVVDDLEFKCGKNATNLDQDIEMVFTPT